MTAITRVIGNLNLLLRTTPQDQPSARPEVVQEQPEPVVVAPAQVTESSKAAVQTPEPPAAPTPPPAEHEAPATLAATAETERPVPTFRPLRPPLTSGGAIHPPLARRTASHFSRPGESEYFDTCPASAAQPAPWAVGSYRSPAALARRSRRALPALFWTARCAPPPEQPLRRRQRPPRHSLIPALRKYRQPTWWHLARPLVLRPLRYKVRRRLLQPRVCPARRYPRALPLLARLPD